MTLLFITRKVDKNDSRAGFVYYWLKKFAKKLDKLIVICQEKEKSQELPENVEIYSFGKEMRYGRLRQFLVFGFLLWKNIRRVDGVFSHMMPIYSIFAGPFCKIFKKKLVQWYTHKTVDWRLRLADIFIDEFVTASKMSLRLQTKKMVNVFGHGIEVDRFVPISRKISNSKFKILTVGRIAPTKDIESMIKAVYELKEEGITDAKLTIVGDIGLASHQAHLGNLKNMVRNMNLDKQVVFTGPVPYTQVSQFYQRANLFINLSDTGSLDKAVLQAMACECLVLTSNEAFEKILSAEFIVKKDEPNELSEKIKWSMNLAAEEKERIGKELRREVVENHNLDKLADRIIDVYEL
ncbi:hypothetical protein AUJ29_00960 [Candidatus Kuenenbacteria bacterium CG1_02_38_13]|uniref:Glycosyl transferase family 1 domain-containing protein n=1 Tax=Candidatus Kuenenbacteria bacterium CG1_02_38_13 TaxID=1805235 RepID=A0A1J4U300_9BACT|nr:MAG: hypothetical protein AUJ29_00960 [Candidatus Kuenenbacteria bacterium CG1_02_38_13]